ncbi:unnamed protein product, partial [marine sediment metagenome]
DASMWDPAPFSDIIHHAELHFTYQLTGAGGMDNLFIQLEYSYDFASWVKIEGPIEVNPIDTNPQHDTASIGAFALTDKAWYRITFHAEDDMDELFIYNAHIVVKQSDVGGIIKCVPEYLMINSTQTGTGDTDFLTSYEPNEWNAEGGYVHHVHCMDCDDDATSIILHDEGDTKLDGSDILGNEDGVDQQSFSISPGSFTWQALQPAVRMYGGEPDEGYAQQYAGDGGKCIGFLAYILKLGTPGNLDIVLWD